MEIKSDKKSLLLGRLFFFLFTFLFLGVFNWEYLYKMQNASYFVSALPYVEETLGQTGGVLIYLSSFLMQLLYYPMLGALLLALLLSLLEFLIERLTRSVVLSFVATGLTLLAMTSVGYALYDMFNASFLFSLPLGLMVGVLLASLSVRLSKVAWGGYAVMALAAASYFVIGVYAWLPLLHSALSSIKNKDNSMIAKTLLAIALCLLLPYIASSFIYYEDFQLAVVAPIPQPYFLNICILSFVALFLVALSPLFADLLQSKVDGLKQRWMPALSLAAMCVLIFFASCNDAEFRTELKMQRLTEAHQWDAVLEVANEVKHPTVTIFAYRAIALSCKNSLSQKLFDYPCNFKKVETSYHSSQLRYYEDLFLYASFLNDAYLWSMEFWCTLGSSYEHLKKMTLFALLNDEPALADKYIQVLKKTMFQRQWAEEHEAYLGDTQKLLERYPEFASVKANIPSQDENLLLSSFSKSYTQYSHLSNRNAERRLLASLYRRDLKSFLRDVLQSQALYARSDAPKCVKEALVICAMQKNDPSLLKGFRVPQSMVNEVERIYNVSRKAANEEVAEKALERLKGNYCYYYLHANN